MRRTTIFITLVIMATPASASDWRDVGKNVSGDSYWVDHETLTRSGDTVTAWVKAEYGTPSATGTASYKAHREIVCATRSFRDLETDYMKANGEMKATTGIEAWRTASPDSIAETVVKAACGL